MENIIKYLLFFFILSCNTPSTRDKKTRPISFDFVNFNEKTFKTILNDSITDSFADTLLNQVRKENCLKIIKITNSSDSSIWIYYFNRSIPTLSPEKIKNFTVDSSNNAQIQGDVIVELFGATTFEIKPKSNKSFLTCPRVREGYAYYELDFSYSKQKNADSFDKYVLKCYLQGDSLVKIE